MMITNENKFDTLHIVLSSPFWLILMLSNKYMVRVLLALVYELVFGFKGIKKVLDNSCEAIIIVINHDIYSYIYIYIYRYMLYIYIYIY